MGNNFHFFRNSREFLEIWKKSEKYSLVIPQSSQDINLNLSSGSLFHFFPKFFWQPDRNYLYFSPHISTLSPRVIYLDASCVSLPFLPNLSEIEFLGLSLEGPFEDLDDELLLLLEELVDGLEGELLELEDLLESFLLGFCWII